MTLLVPLCMDNLSKFAFELIAGMPPRQKVSGRGKKQPLAWMSTISGMYVDDPNGSPMTWYNRVWCAFLPLSIGPRNPKSSQRNCCANFMEKSNITLDDRSEAVGCPLTRP